MPGMVVQLAVRPLWSLIMGPGGTPYCTVADLAQYLPASVLNSTTVAQQTQACLDATEEADSFLRGRYALPLLAWGNDVRRMTAYIACYLLMTVRGFSSAAGSDSLITQRYYESKGTPGVPGSGWFPCIQRQSIHPDVTPSVTQPGDPVHDLPQVRTSQIRGWQQYRCGKPVVG